MLHAGAVRRVQQRKAKKLCMPFRKRRSAPLSDLKVLPSYRATGATGHVLG